MTKIPTIEGVESFIEMITYRRPGRSDTEERFIEKFIDSLGCEKDHFGNRILRIGTVPIMWSCHTDTVHRVEGTQKVAIRNGVVELSDESKKISNCLGADCTTGVWIMTEMIKAGVEGLYIFHRDEESGGKGSNWIVQNTPELVDGIQAAIAFDRYGTTSIITHQMGRCCSDDFADSMIEQMEGFRKDPTGIFTDTAFYTQLIPECTNVSVGYMGHHSSSETQNLVFLKHLLKLMINLRPSGLRVSRDPTVVEKTSWQSHYGWGADEDYSDYFRDDYYVKKEQTDQKLSQLESLIRQNPEAVASLLTLYGITAMDVVEHAFATSIHQ